MAQHAVQWESGDVHTKTFWWDGVWAGLIAGAAFMMIEMLLVWALKGESPWRPPHMMAAMVRGPGVLPPEGTYAAANMGIMLTAMAVHMPLAMMYGLLGAWMVHRFDLGWALVIGAVFGWAIYVLNFLVVAPVLFPWFGMARGGVSIFGHVMFGVILTGSHIALRRRRRQDGRSAAPAAGLSILARALSPRSQRRLKAGEDYN